MYLPTINIQKKVVLVLIILIQNEDGGAEELANPPIIMHPQNRCKGANG